MFQIILTAHSGLPYDIKHRSSHDLPGVLVASILLNEIYTTVWGSINILRLCKVCDILFFSQVLKGFPECLQADICLHLNRNLLQNCPAFQSKITAMADCWIRLKCGWVWTLIFLYMPSFYVFIHHQYSICGKTRGGGVSNVFFTYFNYFSRAVNTNLGLRGTRGGLNPQHPDKSSTAHQSDQSEILKDF